MAQRSLQLVSLPPIKVSHSVEDLHTSHNGEFLIAKGDGQISYLNQASRVLWHGRQQGRLTHLAAGPRQLLLNDGEMICSIIPDATGQWLSKPEWEAETEWNVGELSLSNNNEYIVASLGSKVVLLGHNGYPSKSFERSFTVTSFRISPDGNHLLVCTDGNTLTLLNNECAAVWTKSWDTTIVAIAMGKAQLSDGVPSTDVIVIGDDNDRLSCLDIENPNVELCSVMIGRDQGTLKSVAIGADSNYILAGTTTHILQYDLNWGYTLGLRLPDNLGIMDIFAKLPRILDITMNYDGTCFIIECEDFEQAYHCYELDGQLRFVCPQVQFTPIRMTVSSINPLRVDAFNGGSLNITGTNFRNTVNVSLGGLGPLSSYVRSASEIQAILPDTLKPGRYPITVSDPARGRNSAFALTVADPTLLVKPQLLSTIRTQFITYIQNQQARKRRSAWLQRNIRIEDQILEMYYDAKGYLFVTDLSPTVIASAQKLSKFTDIYIVTLSAQPGDIARIKSLEHVELYLLNAEFRNTLYTLVSLSKTTNIITSQFENFITLMRGLRTYII